MLFHQFTGIPLFNSILKYEEYKTLSMFRNVVETCIYSSNLEIMKNFYVDKVGLELISEEKGRQVYLRAGKNMVLIFNPDVTRIEGKSIFPAHGAMTPPACIHFVLEIERHDYDRLKIMLTQKSIDIEKELQFETGSRSIYFRDPVGNLLEFITECNWPIED